MFDKFTFHIGNFDVVGIGNCLDSVIVLICFYQSHKKKEDSLEGSLDLVLLTAELELPKMLVARRPQHTSDVNTECAGKIEWSKQLYSLHVTSLL